MNKKNATRDAEPGMSTDRPRRRGADEPVATAAPTPAFLARIAAAARQRARAQAGQAGEDLALSMLERHGLRLLERNYRVARGPSRYGGEIDLILRDSDGTLVFVEVRTRRRNSAGGAAASVGPAKRARLLYAARSYLARLERLPPCRFDVVAVDDGQLEWLKAAFDEG